MLTEARARLPIPAGSLAITKALEIVLVDSDDLTGKKARGRQLSDSKPVELPHASILWIYQGQRLDDFRAQPTIPLAPEGATKRNRLYCPGHALAVCTECAQ